ncbi:MAG: helix-turn-helix transcriptional regulator [Cyanobacteriota bacterium]
MEPSTQRSDTLHHPLREQLEVSQNPGICANHLSKVLPLRHFDSLTPPSQWWHCDGALQANQLPIAASIGSPFHLECNGHPLHWLVLVHGGHLTIQQNDQSHDMVAGDGVLLTGHPWTLQAQHSSITTIGCDPLLLLSAARSLAPGQWSPPSALQSPLRSLFPLPTRTDGRCAALVNVIILELPAIHHIVQLGDGFFEGFLLREHLYRLMASLVFADLRQGPSSDGREPSNSDRRLDRLLDYISLHLSEPLPLSVLEEQSHYSRRSLHYAFQERFGCSPLQWIRQQRMQMALQRLRNPLPHDSVASVALCCSYRSQSRFRIDFERSFGCKPSAVLRGEAVPASTLPADNNNDDDDNAS